MVKQFVLPGAPRAGLEQSLSVLYRRWASNERDRQLGNQRDQRDSRVTPGYARTAGQDASRSKQR